jgi:hypothetical protein
MGVEMRTVASLENDDSGKLPPWAYAARFPATIDSWTGWTGFAWP